MKAVLLEVVNLSRRYGQTQALSGVTFTVSDGEVFGLLGPNGAGKTTLMSILSGLLPATSGEVRLLGQKVDPSSREVRRLIGIVPQDLALYGSLTGAENLRFFGELYGLGGRELTQRVEEILNAVGLAERAHHRVQTYSGGMKRRLNLGAALVGRPRLLLLDEPTVGVDPQSRNHIFEEVRRLNKGGLTVIYTSHYMEEVEALCERIGIIDQGKLRACDTLPGLLRLLKGVIRFHVPDLNERLSQRLNELPGCRLVERDGAIPELECDDVKGSLLRLVGLLNETQTELLHLETREPSLERVFLHLTGRSLRD
jgi:ABC-2 type transport system ATP-binding protein